MNPNPTPSPAQAETPDGTTKVFDYKDSPYFAENALPATPKVDHVVQLVSDLTSAHRDVRGLEVVDADFARQLERALTQLRAENEKLRGELTAQTQLTAYYSASLEAGDKEHHDLRQQLTHLKAELERANAEIAAWNDLYSNGPTAAQIALHLNPKKTP